MRFGFDIDGTIAAAPNQYAAIAKALRKDDHKIYVITGHGPQTIREDLLDKLGFEYDTLAIIDPLEDGSGKAAYLRDHQIDFMFENNVNFGNAISLVCPVTFHYAGPAGPRPAELPAEPQAPATAARAKRQLQAILHGGPADGTVVPITGLSGLITVDGHDYRISHNLAAPVGQEYNGYHYVGLKRAP